MQHPVIFIMCNAEKVLALKNAVPEENHPIISKIALP